MGVPTKDNLGPDALRSATCGAHLDAAAHAERLRHLVSLRRQHRAQHHRRVPSQARAPQQRLQEAGPPAQEAWFTLTVLAHPREKSASLAARTHLVSVAPAWSYAQPLWHDSLQPERAGMLCCRCEMGHPKCEQQCVSHHASAGISVECSRAGSMKKEGCAR